MVSSRDGWLYTTPSIYARYCADQNFDYDKGQFESLPNVSLKPSSLHHAESQFHINSEFLDIAQSLRRSGYQWAPGYYPLGFRRWTAFERGHDFHGSRRRESTYSPRPWGGRSRSRYDWQRNSGRLQRM